MPDGARTITDSNAAIAGITKSMGGLAGLIFIFKLIAQFLAYFNYSSIARVIAVHLCDALESANIATWLLLALLVLVILMINFLLRV